MAEQIAGFTGVWKSRRANTAGACFYADRTTRCGMTARSSDILIKPARWAIRCTRCASPAYCPDCGDTVATGHAADCRYTP